MPLFQLQVSGTKPSDKWLRSCKFKADDLEKAAELAMDAWLLWPFADVVKNVGGDEAIFEWAERQLFAHLTVSDKEEW